MVINLLKKISVQIFLLALVARAIFFVAGLSRGEESFAPAINEDAEQYVALAQSILAGRGFTRDAAPPYRPEYWRTPGYPVILSAVGAVYNHLWFAVLIQVIVSALSPVLLLRLSRRWLSGRWVILPAIFMALEPATVYWSVQLTTETIFTFVLLAGIILLFSVTDFVSPKIALFAGIIFGILMMIRPSGAILLPLVIALVFSTIRQNWRRSLAAVILLAVGVSLVTVPWQIRNKRVFNVFEFSPVGNIIGFGKYLSWYTYAKRGLSAGQVYPELDVLKDGNPFLYGHALRSKTISTFLSDPLPYGSLAASSLVPFFFGDGWNTALKFLGARSVSQAQTKWLGSFRELVIHPTKYGATGTLFWVGKFSWLFIVSLAVIGFVTATASRSASQRTHLIFLGLIIILFALSSGVTSYSRFRQPVNPYIFILSVIGLQSCLYPVYLKLFYKNRA